MHDGREGRGRNGVIHTGSHLRNKICVLRSQTIYCFKFHEESLV